MVSVLCLWYFLFSAVCFLVRPSHLTPQGPSLHQGSSQAQASLTAPLLWVAVLGPSLMPSQNHCGHSSHGGPPEPLGLGWEQALLSLPLPPGGMVALGQQSTGWGGDGGTQTGPPQRPQPPAPAAAPGSVQPRFSPEPRPLGLAERAPRAPCSAPLRVTRRQVTPPASAAHPEDRDLEAACPWAQHGSPSRFVTANLRQAPLHTSHARGGRTHGASAGSCTDDPPASARWVPAV